MDPMNAADRPLQAGDSLMCDGALYEVLRVSATTLLAARPAQRADGELTRAHLRCRVADLVPLTPPGDGARTWGLRDRLTPRAAEPTDSDARTVATAAVDSLPS